MEKPQKPSYRKLKITVHNGVFHVLSKEHESKQSIILRDDGRFWFSSWGDFDTPLRRVYKKIPSNFAKEIIEIAEEIYAGGSVFGFVYDGITTELRLTAEDGNENEGRYPGDKKCELFFYLLEMFTDVDGIGFISLQDGKDLINDVFRTDKESKEKANGLIGGWANNKFGSHSS